MSNSPEGQWRSEVVIMTAFFAGMTLSAATLLYTGVRGLIYLACEANQGDIAGKTENCVPDRIATRTGLIIWGAVTAGTLSLPGIAANAELIGRRETITKDDERNNLLK